MKMNSLKRLTLELVKKVVIFEIKRDNETHSFCACILYQPKRPEKGRFQVTNTTASASTTYEKRTGSISVDSTYSYVNTYTLATGSSTKSKGYYTSVEINFSAPYNCHSVRIRSSHKVSAYGQTWSSNSTAVY